MKMKYVFLVVFFCVSTLTQLPASDNQYHKAGVALKNKEKRVAEAVNCIRKALEISRSIKDVNVKEGVEAQLNFSLNILESALFSKNYKEAIDEATALYENIGEILSECTEEKVRDEIIDCINDMMEALEGK